MNDNSKNKELINYYKDKGLVIIGLNDSQGVNVSSTFFRKGLLESLASSLTSEELTPLVIDAFSLLLNKTEHIDYFLKHNLSLEEIKLCQIYSVVSAFSKVMKDIGLPKSIGKIGNIYKAKYKINSEDEKVRLGSSLKFYKEPILIYSSGLNNLMREVGSNPFSIKKDYKLRDTTPNYYYSLEKSTDPNTLTKVIESITSNFDDILNINNNTDIYTLGAYVPKSLKSEEMKVFRELIVAYNDALKNLCKKYNITFVDTEEVGNKYNNSETNFHISSKGHNVLANHILDKMYENKIVLNKTPNVINPNYFKLFGNGTVGVIESLSLDCESSYTKAMDLSGYPQQRELMITDEHRREKEVFEKILTYKKNKTE